MRPRIRDLSCGLLCATAAALGASKAERPAGFGRPIPLLTEQTPAGELAGWKSFHETPGTKTGDVWTLGADGVLICKGTPRGYIYTEKEYGDFVIRFQWRHPKGATKSNGGVLVRTTGENAIWPKCLELQLNMGQAGDFVGIRGYVFTGPDDRMTLSPDTPYGTIRVLKRTADAERPAGEWNEYEAIVDGDTSTIKVNGKEVNRATGCERAPGRILLTSEGQEIHFRNVRIHPKREPAGKRDASAKAERKTES
ncbi:MAG: DUF1080 domain-containing protein [Planctomycetes bacterium]|nr:DUF1080 domain-containing protein [Planctomycetota bacterium]